MAYVRYKVACLLCKSEISYNLLDNHYNSKTCKSGGAKPKLTNCPYCELDISENLDSANHIRWCSKNPKNFRFKHGKTLNCKVCNIQFSLLSHKDKRKTCSKECANTRSEETRTNDSIKRKNFLKNNPDKHPWKRKNKNKSEPCEKFKEYLRLNNIDFIEEYSIDSIKRFFSIDIAFPNLKIGIEINGNQHYDNNGNLNQYYQDRHNIIESAGWKLIEVHYSNCYNIESIKKVLNFNTPFNSNDEIYKIKSSISKTKNNDKQSLKQGQKIKTKTDMKWNPIKDIIFDYNIDFNKFGWVKQVAKVLNIKSQKVHNWMQRYHQEFYKTCFKKQNTKCVGVDSNHH